MINKRECWDQHPQVLSSQHLCGQVMEDSTSASSGDFQDGSCSEKVVAMQIFF